MSSKPEVVLVENVERVDVVSEDDLVLAALAVADRQAAANTRRAYRSLGRS